MKKSAAAILSATLAASALTSVSCSSLSNCSADFTGIRINGHAVKDSLQVSCDPPPSAYVVNVEMDYRTGSSPYTALVRRGPILTIPRHVGFFLNLSVVCLVGWYRAQAETTVVEKYGDPRITTVILGKEIHITDSRQCK